ncbi:unnamed protein product [Mytilus edulis]|uniref:Uncharacterized protein n=1 Tax=Mytilus edulis TaxID=6550 RepID=A0A8S3RJU0_MYTED|nr:unnamed protein product [Mytilus edulis]
MLSKNDQISDKQICERSFTCSIENSEKTGSIDVNCTVGNITPSDDTTDEFHVRITVDDKRTKSHVDEPFDDRSKESHVSSPFDDRSTESYGSYGIPDDDANKKSPGFTNSAFIVGGIAGVLLVICIIVGVFLFSAQKQSEERVTPALNPTYDLNGRPNSEENSHQANIMHDHGAVHCSTSHTVYFDNRTDDTEYAKVNKLRHKHRPEIESIKEESSSYPHPRNTADYSDDLYDHTMHNPVHDISSGYYGITHRRITEDDYDMSGNYRTSLHNDQDSVYN